MKKLGKICSENDSLFLVDFVASGCGCLVDVNDWKIDLGLLATQLVFFK
jgi:aspartate aminotransferase-like enzyme